MKLKTDFADRDELIAYLKETFPDAAERSPEIPETRGGRQAALTLLDAIDPKKYGATRNSLEGAVTRLSPYIRHGVLTLAEVKRKAFEMGTPRSDKFINELGWRDYWQRVYERMGDGIWSDREDYKTGFSAADYGDELPENIESGTTGAVCMDSFSADLRQHGYLHNHARMWMAAYVVHWRRVKWQAGAKWFLTHLLDGDPASNNLSWQWVTSTFSTKPYFFNRANLEKYTDSVYCSRCPLANRGCPFEGSYEKLEAKLFPYKAPESGYERQYSREKGGRRNG
jgi:deoxyribodipyrimidine photo-lyase